MAVMTREELDERATNLWKEMAQPDDLETKRESWWYIMGYKDAFLDRGRFIDPEVGGRIKEMYDRGFDDCIGDLNLTKDK